MKARFIEFRKLWESIPQDMSRSMRDFRGWHKNRHKKNYKHPATASTAEGETIFLCVEIETEIYERRFIKREILVLENIKNNSIILVGDENRFLGGKRRCKETVLADEEVLKNIKEIVNGESVCRQYSDNFSVTIRLGDAWQGDQG